MTRHTQIAPDHPRSRGVYRRMAGFDTDSVGSSPLARGLLDSPHLIPPRPRIIPARAGFTMMHSTQTHPCTDHPRSRGVYNPAIPQPTFGTGSSPLARGLQGIRKYCHHRVRIIPARAGFTCYSHMHITALSDHPRSRGVYLGVGVRVILGPGSSPLARGLHPLDSYSPTEYRIIPARAGFTTRER